MNNIVRRFGQRGATAAEERQEPEAPFPAFLEQRTAPLDEVDARLRDLDKALSVPLPAPVPAPEVKEPLHPDVAKLVSKAQLEAARQTGDEHVKTAQAIFDEAEAALKNARDWRDHVYKVTEQAAEVYAKLHAKQRLAHEGMAKVRAEYLSEELPDAPAA